MTLPRDYDARRLEGPHDHDQPCARCDDTGEYECPECGGTGFVGPEGEQYLCADCSGGLIPCDCRAYAKEQAAEADDDRGDWLRDRREDR